MTQSVTVTFSPSHTLARKRHFLPNEILVPILRSLWDEHSSLRLRTLASASLVCRAWAPAASELLWMDPGPQSIKRLERLARANEFSKARRFRQCGEAVLRLDLVEDPGSRWSRSRVAATLVPTTTRFSRLRSIRISCSNGAVPLAWMCALFRASPSLVAFEMHADLDCPTRYNGLAQIMATEDWKAMIEGVGRLQVLRLDVPNQRFRGVPFESVTRALCQIYAAARDALREVDFYGFSDISTLQDIATTCPSLETILGHRTCASAQVPFEWATHLPALRRADLSRASGYLIDRGVILLASNCPHLVELDLAGLIITNAALEALANVPDTHAPLRALGLSDSPHISAAAVNHLLRARGAHLTRLDVSGNDWVDETLIPVISQHCARISHLKFGFISQGFEGVDDAAIGRLLRGMVAACKKLMLVDFVAPRFREDRETVDPWEAELGKFRADDCGWTVVDRLDVSKLPGMPHVCW
ncbi:hypothetical protein BDK51DRAFT_40055 [Blyttiomyces helicus]|uniref:F-box domain-containing protein n=1 Tax=Blyttiomyces helicus TaxID=388810 RepID=A0A4P9W655_9FUNG|nr:hypothetical protein BDK51DRAFT_40055 [Blyttiomyces helicus]|eukprot:RKO87929.1 hypothetical protein BDK51DRAFT_40055 [Blyttiomyces helicus]